MHSQFDDVIASKQATTRAMPRGHGSIGRPKGRSNSKNHKAGSKREGSGRKKKSTSKTKNEFVIMLALQKRMQLCLHQTMINSLHLHQKTMKQSFNMKMKPFKRR